MSLRASQSNVCYHSAAKGINKSISHVTRDHHIQRYKQDNKSYDTRRPHSQSIHISACANITLHTRESERQRQTEIHRQRHRQRHRQTDRQTGRQTSCPCTQDRQTRRQADRDSVCVCVCVCVCARARARACVCVCFLLSFIGKHDPFLPFGDYEKGVIFTKSVMHGVRISRLP